MVTFLIILTIILLFCHELKLSITKENEISEVPIEDLKFDYYGDKSFDEFLRSQICPYQLKWNEYESIKLLRVVLVRRFNILDSTKLKWKKSSTNIISRYYQYCFDSIIVNSTTENLLQLLETDSFYYLKSILLIFDFSDFDFKSQKPSFIQKIVKTLNEIHWNCNRCRPLVAILNNLHLSTNLIKQIEESLKRSKIIKFNFRSTFIFQENRVVHLRPILYGCLISKSLFIPRSESDFQQLRQRTCLLNQTYLNVSVNHMPPFCRLKIENSSTDGLISTVDDNVPSIEIAFLNILKEKFQFQVNYVYAQQIWGHIDPKTGKINGMLAQVYNGVSLVSSFILVHSFNYLI